MIFAFATDDRTLHVFANESMACSYAEGIDVEDGIWLFFANDGNPLVPSFTKANERRRFSIVSGSYFLSQGAPPNARHLLDILPEVSIVEGELKSVEAVRQLLTNGSS
jgi:hypothetical protein